MNQQDELAHFTGEIVEPEPDIEAEMLIDAVGWRVLLHAHEHVWRDHGWDWRTRFVTVRVLWDLALSLCTTGMVERSRSRWVA